ncbi:hypothetical protein ENKNEFLB_01395 [Nocardioides aquaticus]|uniref:Metal-binding protein n=1 Tax=Nocardioides aquaticus TaxID=160826 RepID=A0ABX8EGL1_9ACTN|nr:hypothetical protein [Nocardioides aquaticus]QVT79015.1 hypothetical protein ENKNEFLB_01395 [Nocardioides aquaticus]
MSALCGDPACLGRVQAFLTVPDDRAIGDPCARCLEAMGRMLDVAPPPRTLAAVYVAVSEAL